MLSGKAFQKLNYLLKTWEVTPVGYVDTPLGRIYIAEGWQARRPNRDGTNEGPGWTVLWAVLHQGAAVAQGLYVKSLPNDDIGRKRIALEEATKFLTAHHGKAKTAKDKAPRFLHS